MKNIAIFSILILLLISCKAVKDEIVTNPDLPPPFNGPGVTRERVLAIAAKYGLQDSMGRNFNPPPEAAYPYMSEEFFEGYFANWRKHFDWLARTEDRWKKLENMQTLQQYFTYVESDPETYKRIINENGGTDDYNAYKKDALAGKYHIYICKHPKMGTYPTIVPADDDKPGTINGRLLRNEN